MTNDKATFTIEFADEVSTGAIMTVEGAADGDILSVETEADGNVLTATVWGDGNAINVYESQFMEELGELYPSAEIVDCDVEPGAGVENCPQNEHYPDAG